MNFIEAIARAFADDKLKNILKDGDHVRRVLLQRSIENETKRKDEQKKINKESLLFYQRIKSEITSIPVSDRKAYIIKLSKQLVLEKHESQLANNVLLVTLANQKIKSLNTLYDNFDSIDFIDQEITRKSFHYNLADISKLKNTFDKLARSGLICKETSWGRFNSVFDKNKKIKKVNWIGTKSELYFFIKSIVELKSIDAEQKWITTSLCFKVNNKSILPKEFHSIKVPTSIKSINRVNDIIDSLR